MSLPLNQWKTVEVDLHTVDNLTKDMGISRTLAMLLVSRGISEPTDAEKFLNPRLSDMSDPFELPDMDIAVERLWGEIDSGGRIVVFGDYDVDGITSSALTAGVLRKLGAKVNCFLPDRITEGYGLTQKSFDRCIRENAPSLVVTVDCGTGAADVLANARARGIDVIVTDHHTPPDVLPETLANINPRIFSNPEAAELSGVGVAFKLCHALIKKGILDNRPEVKQLDLREWLDLVAVGTVADLVPLIGENRILVKHGLKYLNGKCKKGLMALKKFSGVSRDVDVHGISFILGPRLNAAGRVGDPHLALELLLTEDDECAQALAGELEGLNLLRKDVEKQIFFESKAGVNTCFDLNNDMGIVAAGQGWHPGVLGIVASRLVGVYGRPCVVIGIDEQGVGHGSCRSIEQMNILEVLKECAELLENFGGHAAAAGLSIRKENIEKFRKTFVELCGARLKNLDIRPSLRVDAWIAPGELGRNLHEIACDLQPCGTGNPAPVWGIRQARVLGEARAIGQNKNHLKMIVCTGGTQIDAIAFDFAEHGLPNGVFDVVFEIEPNTYMGTDALQMRVKDAKW